MLSVGCGRVVHSGIWVSCSGDQLVMLGSEGRVIQTCRPLPPPVWLSGPPSCTSVCTSPPPVCVLLLGLAGSHSIGGQCWAWGQKSLHFSDVEAQASDQQLCLGPSCNADLQLLGFRDQPISEKMSDQVGPRRQGLQTRS